MFYRGMPDLYRYQDEENVYDVFWHDGEFYLHDRLWYAKGLSKAEEFRFFDTADETLTEMLKIGAYKDWKQVPMEYPDE
jgi:hypothetical protein